MNKRLYIAYTGGTIGMRPTADGYAPAPGFLAEQMAAMPELRDPRMPAYDIHEYAPLLDSSNMTPRDWIRIGRDIVEHYAAYDGIIVLHGTDTMAYTASALPFFLQGLRKPVILTGSQIPLCEIRNDARANLITSMSIAAEYPVPEVCLYFGDKLLRGCRAVKVDADGLDAFDSPNYPPLGTVGVKIEIDASHLAPASTSDELVLVNPVVDATVGAFRLFPGLSPELLCNVLKPPLQGLVLETYGVGNGPDRDQAFLAVIEEATDRGVVIVDVTQCLRGSVHLGEYATGAALARAGVISGYDLTAEAALCKLFYLFSAGYSPEEVRARMVQDLCGELTVPPNQGDRRPAVAGLLTEPPPGRVSSPAVAGLVSSPAVAGLLTEPPPGWVSSPAVAGLLTEPPPGMNISLTAIAKMIDHSLLHPTMTDAELRQGCELARRLDVAAVCIKPYAVAGAVELLRGSGVAVGTVVGFPHGNSHIAIKLREAELACQEGATELDMVVNIGRALGGDWDYVSAEIKALTTAAHKHGAIIKVIFENDYLPEDDPKIRLCEICAGAGADFVKTSTGYGFVKGADGTYAYLGATDHDLRLMRAHCPPQIQVKAAGGVRTLDDVLRVRALGVTRVGATATEAILAEARRRGFE
ncbi:MAG: hypothetical protein CVU38_14340 [Chloroflexi bacterium HGW-Chloroflexi-1]|nr:MAG: hypothetical protein CVU38_14340 [Chloroflexi bacterium HGW-Chloroflexi-1]